MAMSVAGGGGGGGRRRRGRGGNRPMSEINVTPMVDVMLVLLIIFMVAAPLLTAGVPIDLPQTQARELSTPSEPITVSVTPTGETYIGEDPVPMDQLVARIGELAENGTEDRIFVRGDTTANYGSVMQVMGLLNQAGYSKIGLITEQVRAQ
jgi:biopolymer transport protein TolR